MRRSYKLIVDTHTLGDSSATGMQAITLETPFQRHLSHIYGAGTGVPTIGSGGAELSNGQSKLVDNENDSRLRILKDSSSDFLAPYNPNVVIMSSTTTKTTTTTKTSTEKTTTIPEATSRSITTELQKKPKNTLTSNPAENEILVISHSGSSVKRTKITDSAPLTHNSEIIVDATTILAVLIAILLFLVLVGLFLFVRPATHKQVPRLNSATTATTSTSTTMATTIPLKGATAAASTMLGATLAMTDSTTSAVLNKTTAATINTASTLRMQSKPSATAMLLSEERRSGRGCNSIDVPNDRQILIENEILPTSILDLVCSPLPTSSMLHQYASTMSLCSNSRDKSNNTEDYCNSCSGNSRSSSSCRHKRDDELYSSTSLMV